MDKTMDKYEDTHHDIMGHFHGNKQGWINDVKFRNNLSLIMKKFRTEAQGKADLMDCIMENLDAFNKKSQCIREILNPKSDQGSRISTEEMKRLTLAIGGMIVGIFRTINAIESHTNMSHGMIEDHVCLMVEALSNKKTKSA